METRKTQRPSWDALVLDAQSWDATARRQQLEQMLHGLVAKYPEGRSATSSEQRALSRRRVTQEFQAEFQALLANALPAARTILHTNAGPPALSPKTWCGTNAQTIAKTAERFEQWIDAGLQTVLRLHTKFQAVLNALSSERRARVHEAVKEVLRHTEMRTGFEEDWTDEALLWLEYLLDCANIERSTGQQAVFALHVQRYWDTRSRPTEAAIEQVSTEVWSLVQP